MFAIMRHYNLEKTHLIYIVYTEVQLEKGALRSRVFN